MAGKQQLRKSRRLTRQCWALVFLCARRWQLWQRAAG
jgi:hypothetical protein